MREKFDTEHIQIAEKALMYMLTTGHAAATNGLKDASFRCIKNILTEMTFKRRVDDFFTQNIERWSQAPEFIDAFTEKVLSQRTFTISMSTIVKQRVNNTVSEWRLNVKEEAQSESKTHSEVPPSLPYTPSSKVLQDLARRKPERAHERK